MPDGDSIDAAPRPTEKNLQEGLPKKAIFSDLNLDEYQLALNEWQEKLVISTKNTKLNSSVSQSLKEYLVYGEPLISSSGNAKKTLVTYGDSHAYALFPMLNSSGASEKFLLVNNTLPCQAALLSSTKERSDCVELREEFFKMIEDSQPSLIVLTDNAPGYIESDGNLEPWKIGLEKSLSLIAKNSDRFIFFGTNPYLNRPIVDCILSNGKINSNCTGRSATNNNFRSIQKELTIKYGGVFVDTTDWFCVSGSCPALSNGFPIFSDIQHISKYFSGKTGILFMSLLSALNY